MGPLTFPEHGPIYLDATSLIYSVERVEPFRTVLEPLWDQAKAGRYKLVTSELSVLETLVKPKRDGNSTLERLFRAAMFDATELNSSPQRCRLGRRLLTFALNGVCRHPTRYMRLQPCSPDVQLSSPTMLIFAA